MEIDILSPFYSVLPGTSFKSDSYPLIYILLLDQKIRHGRTEAWPYQTGISIVAT